MEKIITERNPIKDSKISDYGKENKLIDSLYARGIFHISDIGKLSLEEVIALFFNGENLSASQIRRREELLQSLGLTYKFGYNGANILQELVATSIDPNLTTSKKNGINSIEESAAKTKTHSLSTLQHAQDELSALGFSFEWEDPKKSKEKIKKELDKKNPTIEITRIHGLADIPQAQEELSALGFPFEWRDPKRTEENAQIRENTQRIARLLQELQELTVEKARLQEKEDRLTAQLRVLTNSIKESGHTYAKK